MLHRLPATSAVFTILFLASCRSIPSGVPAEYASVIEAETYLAGLQVIEACSRPDTPCNIGSGTALESVTVNESTKLISVNFNEYLGFQPMRSDGVRYIEQVIRDNVSKSENYAVNVTTGRFGISELVPNLYRDYSMPRDASRVPRASVTRPIITELGSDVFDAGLSNRHIALWPSHGWYYEHRLNRWEWQRARLFQTVEDLLPFSFVIPYLAPMLENAGANVFIPRERDVQTNEVVVDNDTIGSGWSTSDSLTWAVSSDTGFGIGHPPYQPMDRPFREGTYSIAPVSPVATDTIRWTPDIPEEGEYAIYIAYATVDGSTAEAAYSVNYSGGTKHFSVNQQIGGRTWIYLGTFHFFAGSAPELGSVYLTNGAASGRMVTADAVRFGGGMGNVERNGQISGRPRYTEAARYFMQYSGMPDSLVFDVADGDDNDYVDDYRSRGEWVNYLRGNPYGPNKDTSQGLGIPIDLSLAFHTDAGVTKRDTTIGTLLIYSTPGMDTTGVFPDGVSRLANRDFADILQTEITHSIRSKYDSTWTRRSMWDKDYSEAHRPNVPAALLELLSHQNFEDMRYGLDPQFKFDASRAIYKSMLKYLADAYGYSPVVQPLPVDHLTSQLNTDHSVTLSWQPVEDPIEETATPTHYKVYTAIDSTGFDSGRNVTTPFIRLDPIASGHVYRYRVTGLNAGGESFPSSTVSVGLSDSSSTTVLIVDGFDRVSAPASIQSDEITGFFAFLDEGVPYVSDMAFTGEQYDYATSSQWLDDDSPGHGASDANFETGVIAGNTFDYSYDHGISILASGRSFVTVSDESFSNDSSREGDFDMSPYSVLDYILGEERRSDPPGQKTGVRFEAFPESTRAKLTAFTAAGGSLLISGAYVGTDLFVGAPRDSEGPTFGQDILGIKWRTNHAARQGRVSIIDDRGVVVDTLSYQSDYSSEMYKVEAPDAIEPSNTLGWTFARFAENNTSAGVMYDTDSYRVVTLGFPIETITDTNQRNRLMQTALDFLTADN